MNSTSNVTWLILISQLRHENNEFGLISVREGIRLVNDRVKKAHKLLFDNFTVINAFTLVS